MERPEGIRAPRGAEGVGIIPVISYKKGKKTRKTVLCNVIYRVALNKYVVEFPAGIVHYNDQSLSGLVKWQLASKKGLTVDSVFHQGRTWNYFPDPHQNKRFGSGSIAYINGDLPEN